MKIKVEDVKQGFKFIKDGCHYWTAIEDAKLMVNGLISIRVEHEPDGGIEDRFFDPGGVITYDEEN